MRIGSPHFLAKMRDAQFCGQIIDLSKIGIDFSIISGILVGQ
jgi:hypothetical protein